MRSYRRIAVVLAVIILACGIFSDAEKMVATATTQQQIDQAQQEWNELQGNLSQTQQELEGFKETQGTLQGELKTLNKELTKVSENLAELESRIEAKEAEIVQTQTELEEAKKTEDWQYDCMVIRVRDMYERNDTSYINAILNAGSFSEMINAADYFEKIADYDQRKLQEFKEIRALIEQKELKLQSDKAELENLKVEAEAEQNRVNGLISQTSNSIAHYADQIEQKEKEALEYEAQIKQKEADLATLRKKLAEELALSQSAANGVWRDISEVEFAEGDRYLLANLIYCEAGGEPYDGKVAVGSVVINRVLSNKFPDTVVGVIYQRKQFSPVASGRLELALSANRATASCYQAADEAMSGVSNVGNCVFFRTPIPGLEGINIGGHVFY